MPLMFTSSVIMKHLECTEDFATDLIRCYAINGVMDVLEEDFTDSNAYRKRLVSQLDRLDTLSGLAWTDLIDITMDFRRWLSMADMGSLGGYNNEHQLMHLKTKYRLLLPAVPAKEHSIESQKGA